MSGGGGSPFSNPPPTGPIPSVAGPCAGKIKLSVHVENARTAPRPCVKTLTTHKSSLSGKRRLPALAVVWSGNSSSFEERDNCPTGTFPTVS